MVLQRSIYSAEDQDSTHLFKPHMQQGIQIAIKTRALQGCREMDLHPNSSRVLALTLLRTGSESNSRKPSLLNRKPQYFNGHSKLSTNAQLRPWVWCSNTPDNNSRWSFIIPMIHLPYQTTAVRQSCTPTHTHTHTHTFILWNLV